jgi:hypothetical protein
MSWSGILSFILKFRKEIVEMRLDVRGLPLIFEKCMMLFHGTFGSALAVLSLAACAKSPSPTISPSVNIESPKFDGNITKLTTATQSFVLTGTCDRDVDGLQYSLDSTTWTDVSGGCTGTFTIRANVNRTLTLSVRAKVKIFFSDMAQVLVSFVPPPTSTSLTFVSSSNSDSDSNPNVVNTLGPSFSGQVLSNGQVALKTYLPRMIYETQ